MNMNETATNSFCTSMNIFKRGPRGVQSLQMVLFNCSNAATSPPPPPAGFALAGLALQSRSPSGVQREPCTGANCSLGNTSGTSPLVMVMENALTASQVGNKNVPSRKGHCLLAQYEHNRSGSAGEGCMLANNEVQTCFRSSQVGFWVPSWVSSDMHNKSRGAPLLVVYRILLSIPSNANSFCKSPRVCLNP